MKTNCKALLGAFTLVGLALLLPSCEKPGSAGREVLFSAVSNADGSGGKTRTHYSGEFVTSNSHKYERIDWRDNDRIRIASNLAQTPGGLNYADYLIQGSSIKSSSSGQSQARINSVDVQGLQWGDGLGSYRFMAVYPHSATINISEGAVSGMSIPSGLNLNPQEGELTDLGDNKTKVTFEPDMSSAWMVADAQSVTEGSDVNLNFYPAFTAFEFNLGLEDGGDPVTLTSFTLSSASHPINGSFSASWPQAAAAFSYSGFSAANATTRNTTVSFGSGVEITVSKFLTFTIFALPDDFNDLSITVNGVTQDSKSFSRTMALKDDNGFVQFLACKKHRILGLQMPDGDFRLVFDFQVADWVEATDNPYAYTSPLSGRVVLCDNSYRRFDSDDGFATAAERTPYPSSISGDDDASWVGSSILVSYGYKNHEGSSGGEIVPVDDDEIANDFSGKYAGYRAAFSPVIALATKNDGSAVLRLVLDNPMFKFIQYGSSAGLNANHCLSDTIDITGNLTYFSVVPVSQFKNDNPVHDRVCTVSLLSVAEGTLHEMSFNLSGTGYHTPNDAFYRLPGDSDKQLRFFYVGPASYGTTGVECDKTGALL